MTLELVDLLKTEIETLLEANTYKNPQDEDVAMNVYAQSLPAKIAETERYPSIRIRSVRGSESGSLDVNKTSISFVIGLYDKDNDFQGDRGIMTLIEMIKEHFNKSKYIDKYRITNFNWMLNDEDVHPFYFGGIETEFEYPKELTTTGNQLSLFAVEELKIYKVLTDSSSSITYDTGKTIEDITKLSFTPTLNSNELDYGGNIHAMHGRYSGGEWSIDGNITDFEIMALLNGETYTSETSPLVFTSKIKGNSKSINFKIEAKVKYLNSDNALNVADMHIIIPKCQLNIGSESNINNNLYLNMSLSGKAYMPDYGGKAATIREIKTYNTVTNLST